MIQVHLKTFDDEYQPTGDDIKEVSLQIACKQFDLLVDACRQQSIRLHFERCNESEIALSTDMAPDGVVIGLLFAPCEGSDDFLSLLRYVEQTEGKRG